MKPLSHGARADASRSAGVSAEPEANGVAWGTRGLTVLLARNGDAKARLLSSWQRGLAAPLRANGSNGAAATNTRALLIDAHDLTTAASAADAELAALQAGDESPERAARQAIAALRTRADALLAEDGSAGRIAALTARLRVLDRDIGATLDAEDGERRRIAPLLAAAAAIVDLERERDRLLNERACWSLVIHLWPEWQRLQQARRDLDVLASFEHLPADLESRLAALEQRAERAERTLRSARREISRLTSERDELRDGEPLQQLSETT